jgi:short subunit dehydrogenase-like uncharacterized protein
VTNIKHNRNLDIVVFGATGFTGTLVTEYLLRQYGIGQDVRWAIAGRSASKLAEVKAQLGDSAADLEAIVADSSDESALASLASRPLSPTAPTRMPWRHLRPGPGSY